MSQSPADAANPDPGADYFRSWDALGMMLSRGQSFSGLERDCVFLNTGGPRFANISAASGLDLIDDGRALAATDWDRDGDQDIWVGNRTGPRVRLMRNGMDAGNAFISLRLQGVQCNRDAIGARVEVELAGTPPRKLIRSLRAGDGFLSQSTKRLHFGLERPERIARLTVRWPDGSHQDFPNVAINRHYLLIQGSELAEDKLPERSEPLATSTPHAPAPTQQARVVFTLRRLLPELAFRDLAGKSIARAEFADKPLLINLWASWCPPCREELNEWAARAKELEAAGWKVVLACTDRVGDAPSDDLEAARRFIEEHKLPFLVVEADTQFVRQLNLLHNQSLYKERSLPLPTTFAVDRDGKLACVYRGPVSVDTLIDDAWLIAPAAEADDLLARAFPFPGEFLYRRLEINPITWSRAYRDGGYLEESREELVKWLAATPVETRAELAELQPSQVLRATVLGELAQVELQLGHRDAALAATEEMTALAAREARAHLTAATVLTAAGEAQRARQSVESALALAPDDPAVLHEAGRTLMAGGEADQALTHLRRARELRPDDPAIQLDLATILQLQGETQAAIATYRDLLASHPESHDAANNLAWLYATHVDDSVRDGAEAVRLAEAACAATGRQVAPYLGTLAAAYAEAGRFDDAVAAAEEAQLVARGAGQAALAQHLAEREAQYRQRQPYRDSATR